MGDADKTHSIVKLLSNHSPVALELMNSHHALMRINRYLLAVVCVLMIIVLVGGFLLLPDEDFINDYKKSAPTEIYASEMNPVLSGEVNTLKRQLVGLMSGSIESKLNALEESIRVGSLSSSIGTIEELKNDLKVLKTYTDAAKKEVVVISNEQLVQEVSHLKHLIYLSLASCGLMLAAVAGIWIRSRHRLSHHKPGIKYLAND